MTEACDAANLAEIIDAYDAELLKEKAARLAVQRPLTKAPPLRPPHVAAAPAHQPPLDISAAAPSSSEAQLLLALAFQTESGDAVAARLRAECGRLRAEVARLEAKVEALSAELEVFRPPPPHLVAN